jgi:hypothetical protein
LTIAIVTAVTAPDWSAIYSYVDPRFVSIGGDCSALHSRLFVGDAALEAAAASDAAHIAQGSSGPHVRKIQTGLNLVDGAKLNADGSYGRLTAAAVLNYKRARAIINTARQTEADDIVGRMTVAALDAELVDAESPKGPIRIKPVFTAAGGHSQSQLKARALVAFGLNDFRLFPAAPPFHHRPSS